MVRSKKQEDIEKNCQKELNNAVMIGEMLRTSIIYKAVDNKSDNPRKED